MDAMFGRMVMGPWPMDGFWEAGLGLEIIRKTRVFSPP
jgi:hypothetical protein